MSTELQQRANQANAQLSTGPKTEAGKAKSSRNALKTGLTGRAVLLSTEEAAAYEQHLENLSTQHQPAGDAERELLQSIADTQWRLQRIPSLEAGIYALGRREFAELFPEEEAPVRAALIDAHTYLACHRNLANLSTQETRLYRRLQLDLAELTALQTARQKKVEAQTSHAAAAYLACQAQGKPFRMADYTTEFGFEISIEEVERAAVKLRARREEKIDRRARLCQRRVTPQPRKITKTDHPPSHLAAACAHAVSHPPSPAQKGNRACSFYALKPWS
jgi:hypothetical protein